MLPDEDSVHSPLMYDFSMNKLESLKEVAKEAMVIRVVGGREVASRQQAFGPWNDTYRELGI